jgi:hypothetical protein
MEAPRKKSELFFIWRQGHHAGSAIVLRRCHRHASTATY